MSVDIKVEIAQRLGVDDDELQPVLETVVQRIRQQVAHYGYARLAGLGTFRGRDGALLFEPDPALAEAVNLRFAGLEPVPLQSSPVNDDPSRSDAEQVVAPEAGDPTTLPEEQPLSALADENEKETGWQDFDEAERNHPLGPLPPSAFEDAEYSVLDEEPVEEFDPVEPEDVFQAAVEPEPELEPDDENLGAVPAAREDEFEDGAEGDEEDEGPLQELSFDDGGDEESRDDAEGARAQPEEATVLAATAAQSDEAGEAVREADEEATERSLASDREPPAHEGEDRDWPSRSIESAGDEDLDSRRNTLLIVLGIVVLLAAAAVGYFAMQPPRGTEPEIAAETEQPVETPAVGDESVDEEADETVGNAESEDSDGTDEPPASTDSPDPAEQQAESTALRGAGGISTADGGFTIVVFSEISEGSAENVAQRYEGQGFRSDVIPSQEGGGTRFRVGVGQFETLEDAMDARNELAGTQLPADAWVYRLE